jgi:hypothetical protein
VNEGTGGPPIGPGDIDHALQRLRSEQDAISAALLDLEHQPGHQLLDGAELTGVTKRRWARAKEQIGSLWQMFDLYREALGRAERVRSRHARPGQAELAELAHLLTGASVELTGEEIPLAERSLVGPARVREWLSLDTLVARMNGTYAQVTEVVGGADAAWSELLPRLERIERSERTAADLARSVEPGGSIDARLTEAGRALAELRRAVRTDPLSLVAGGRPDVTRLDRMETDLADLITELEAADRIKTEYATKVGEIGDVLERVEAAQAEAHRARERVLVRIAAHEPPPVPEPARALRGRLAALEELRRQGRWIDLAKRTAGLAAAAADARDQICATLGAIMAPLHRRDELRGRLNAYGVKAARLGHAEDGELNELHQRAHDLLWRAPCDIKQATMAVQAYQQAIDARGRRST